MSQNTNKKTDPADRQHPFLRDGEELDPTKPPQDIRKFFHRTLISNALLQQMLEKLEDEETGMVEGTAIHAVLFDFKRLKFVCIGIANAYAKENDEQLAQHIDTLGAMLNINVQQTTKPDVTKDSPEGDGE